MRVLIVYGTTEGMTGRIAERMGKVALALGHDADVVQARTAGGLQLERYDAVLVGGSVHLGSYQRSVRRFVVSQRGALAGTRSAFFSVCLAIASRNARDRQGAQRIADAFPARLGWRPDAVQIFSGALMFSRYGLLRRALMRAIAQHQMGGEIDTHRDHIYTDWAAVERFVREFLAPRPPAERPMPPRGPEAATPPAPA